MKTIDDSDILSELKPKIENRVETLLNIFNDFLSMLGDSKQDGLQIDNFLLREAVSNYFAEIDRYRQYHLINSGVNKVKSAAFLASWIIRTRPIFFKTEIQIPSALHRTANSMYALSVLSAFAEIDFSLIPYDLYKNIIYSIEYRSHNSDQLALLSLALKEISDLNSGEKIL